MQETMWSLKSEVNKQEVQQVSQLPALHAEVSSSKILNHKTPSECLCVLEWHEKISSFALDWKHFCFWWVLVCPLTFEESKSIR